MVRVASKSNIREHKKRIYRKIGKTRIILVFIVFIVRGAIKNLEPVKYKEIQEIKINKIISLIKQNQ